MKKIRLFSTKVTKDIEGSEAELYVNFYLVLNRNYIFTFLIDAPNLACSNRNPIRLWKQFLMMFEEEYVKYMRRYEEQILLKQTRNEKMIDAIDFAIKATDSKDNYSMGMRNGMRYVKSLIDGKVPQYE